MAGVFESADLARRVFWMVMAGVGLEIAAMYALIFA